MVTSPHIKKTSLEEMVQLAQQGDEFILNYLLETYQPFIAKNVSEVCKRYIDPKSDDEFSIGLSAFNEAIMQYAPNRGSFFTFAKLVVKRKVIDYIRYTTKHPIAVSLDEAYGEEQMENLAEISLVKANYRLEEDGWNRKQEILEFSERLSDFKITMTELAKVSPKHRDARASAIKTAKILYNDVELRSFVKLTYKLPIKEMVKLVEVSKKTLERNRKFIIAIFIVLDSEYVFLKEYVKGIGL